MLWLEILRLQEPDHQEQRDIIAWPDTQDAPQVEATHRWPLLLKQQCPGIRHKEQKSRKHEEKGHARSALHCQRAGEKIYYRIGLPDMDIDGDQVEMK